MTADNARAKRTVLEVNISSQDHVSAHAQYDSVVKVLLFIYVGLEHVVMFLEVVDCSFQAGRW